MTTTAEIHEAGAKRHRADWLDANHAASGVLMGPEVRLRIDDPDVKFAVPLILLRVLDRIRLRNGERWNSKTETWESVE